MRGRHGRMAIEQHPFGKTRDGHAVDLFTLSSGGIVVKVTNFGGRITEWHLAIAGPNGPGPGPGSQHLWRVGRGVSMGQRNEPANGGRNANLRRGGL